MYTNNVTRLLHRECLICPGSRHSPVTPILSAGEVVLSSQGFPGLTIHNSVSLGNRIFLATKFNFPVLNIPGSPKTQPGGGGSCQVLLHRAHRVAPSQQPLGNLLPSAYRVQSYSLNINFMREMAHILMWET